jgi:hypothetical protein
MESKKMHRERVLERLMLCVSRGEAIPDEILDNIERQKIFLPPNLKEMIDERKKNASGSHDKARDSSVPLSQ